MGHGLIEEEREKRRFGTIPRFLMCGTFRWYKDLSRLLKASPVVDKDTSANSATDLDLSVLGDMSDTSGDEGMVEGGPGSPHLDAPELDEKITKTGCTLTGTHVRQPSTMLPSQIGTKGYHGSFLDKVFELAASQHAAISAVIKKNNEARRERKRMETETAVQIK
ncbi:hypothetical protein K439DRAFT_932022 [Ramaria rubella]|nr:hypothetical protein K439DRAFT_932022 [Ramaria rubella]